jgi:predicted transcriptional regulator
MKPLTRGCVLLKIQHDVGILADRETLWYQVRCIPETVRTSPEPPVEGERRENDVMSKDPHDSLSRRERQIMDIMYRLGQASATEVMEALPDPPSYSAVRAHLRILEEKGHLEHEQDGPRYVFRPTVPRERARISALEGLLRNFFDGSGEQMVAALLDADSDLNDEELARIAKLIDQARKEGR